MRKIYSLVVLLVALLTSSVAASAANVTFKTLDPSKVTIGWRQYYSGTPDPLEWNSGDFTYDLSDGYIVIKPVAGYEFVTTTATLNGGPVSYPSFPAEGEEFALASYYVTEGDVYYFETQVMKIKQATLKVDDYTHISVNNGGEAVDLTSNEMTLDKPAGTYARLEVNASDEYLLSSVKVAGEEKLSTPNVESWNAYWSDFSDGAVIEIATTERPAKTLNIKADPEFVVVKYLDTEVEATDVSGVKTFVVPNVAKNKYVEIFAREGYALEGLRNEDRTDEEYMMTGAVYTNISEYSMKYGDNNYSVGTYNKESRRTAKFKITVDQPENLYIKQYNTIEYKPVAGEEANVFNFNAELDKPVSLEVYDSHYDYDQWKTVYDFPFIYLNGERIECPMDESGYSYDFMAYPGLDALKDGDVMKMFKAEPSTYEVSFKLGEGVEVKDVVTDGYTAVESVAEPLTLFQNTALSFALPALENERQSYVMTLNDEDVEVPADGKFSYKVDADKAFDISIYTEPEQGITNVNGDAAANTDVYNLQGILMIRNASKEQISNLPEGLYIVGDKKVIVK